MKKFNGYNEAKKAAESTASAKLPVGGYVCKVLDVIYEENEWGDRLVLQFDIAEGDYKDFFRKKYNSDTSEDKRWKGAARINVPSDDGSERDGWTKNSFARWINGFEKSNAGFAWAWNENELSGKYIGIVFREMNKMIGDKPCTYTEASSGASVEDIRSGKFYQPKPYFSKDYAPSVAAPSANKDDFMSVPADAEEEIPF